MTPHWSLDNAVFWSGVFFAFGGVEAASAMGDEIENPRKTMPWAILVGGTVVTLGYIGGTMALLVALPSDAVSGLQGFVNGVEQLVSTKLGVGWMLVPIALLVGVNSVGSTAANLSSTSRLPFVAASIHDLPLFGLIDRAIELHGSRSACMDWRACWWRSLGRWERPVRGRTTCW